MLLAYGNLPAKSGLGAGEWSSPWSDSDVDVDGMLAYQANISVKSGLGVGA
jgi:hypothetical protein